MTTANPPTRIPLGRGLSALFGDSDTAYQPKPAPATNAASPAASSNAAQAGGARAPMQTSPQKLPVSWLQPGAFQPRRYFDEEALKGLAGSIAERGILEPLVVRPIKGAKDSYEIIAGERRWRAAQQAHLHDVPVVIRELSDREALEFGLIENVQRQDLSPLEEAEGYNRLLQEFSHTQDNLAKIVGKSRPHIGNMLRLLTLPKEIRDWIDQGRLTMGHARALLTARDPIGLAEQIINRNLSVRDAEKLGQQNSYLPKAAAKKKAEAAAPQNADTALLEKELERVIGLKVKIDTRGKAGSLTLHYNDLDQLDDIIRRLRG